MTIAPEVSRADDDGSRTFSMRGTKPTGILLAIAGVTLVEATVLHLLVAPHLPWLAYASEALGIASFGWVWRRYDRRSREVARITPHGLVIGRGAHTDLVIPWSIVLRLERPTWQQLPAKGTPAAKGFANITAPVEPNVLVTTDATVTVRLLGLVSREVTRIGFYVDGEPSRLLAAAAPYLRTR